VAKQAMSFARREGSVGMVPGEESGENGEKVVPRIHHEAAAS
jgi:hypothetical protein